MAKIDRKHHLIFGLNGSVAGFGQFGSLASGVPALTKNIEQIQSLPEYLQGWTAAILGENSPAVEDMNALSYVFSYQIAYGLQSGVPEWDDSTEYHIGSFASDGLGNLYVSIVNDNLDNALTDVLSWSKYLPKEAEAGLIFEDNFEKDVSDWTLTNGVTTDIVVPASLALTETDKIHGNSSLLFTAAKARGGSATDAERDKIVKTFSISDKIGEGEEICIEFNMRLEDPNLDFGPDPGGSVPVVAYGIKAKLKETVSGNTVEQSNIFNFVDTYDGPVLTELPFIDENVRVKVSFNPVDPLIKDYTIELIAYSRAFWVAS